MSDIIEVRFRHVRGGVAVAWGLPGGSFERTLGAADIDELSRLGQAALDVPDRAWQRGLAPLGRAVTRPAQPPLADFGERLGRLAIGGENAPLLRDGVNRSHQRFRLVSIDASEPDLARLPWEALVVPGDPGPLLFQGYARGWIDFARDCPLGHEPSLRRDEMKCLAAWSLVRRGELLVKPQLEELRDRLARGFEGRFRWVDNPTLDELRGRLRLECSLFLYAGHGQLHGDGYGLELAQGQVPAEALVDDLRAARAEVLILDACESGLGDGLAGMPRLLRRLPTATCLLGMQGPASDIVSRAHMPALVERVLLGEPIARAVNVLRLDLFEQGREDWLRPVLHVKRTYRPFPAAQRRQSYLDALLGSLGEGPR